MRTRVYDLTVPDIGFAGMLLAWASEASIPATWDGRRTGGPVVITCPTGQDRSALLALARRKIRGLGRFPEIAARFQRHFEAIY